MEREVLTMCTYCTSFTEDDEHVLGASLCGVRYPTEKTLSLRPKLEADQRLVTDLHSSPPPFQPVGSPIDQTSIGLAALPDGLDRVDGSEVRVATPAGPKAKRRQRTGEGCCRQSL
jgi:hypothetical protein